jgi:predicted ATPase
LGRHIGREFSHALLASVVRQSEAQLGLALNRLIAAGLLFRQGVPPHASYLFKHALVQDTAYGTLLREPRRALHARIADTLESQFAEIAEHQPELLAQHCTEAGLAHLERSLAVARAQQAKSWELRAAMSVARLWANQSKRDEARGVLAPVYGWFTEGFDTHDLKAAKVLLEALAS